MTSPLSHPRRTRAPGARGHDDTSTTDARLLLALADDACGADYDPAALDEADRLRRRRHPVLDGRPDWRSSRVLKQRCRPWLARGCPWSLSHSHGHAVLALWLPAGIEAPVARPCATSPAWRAAPTGGGTGAAAHAVAIAVSEEDAGADTDAGAGHDADRRLFRIGVDLERIRPRDFAALLPQFAQPEDMAWWRAQPDPAVAFYRLWTLKEALLKAGGLDFPADLRRVGLRPPESAEQAAAGQRTGQAATQDGLVGAWPLRSPAGRGWHGLSTVLNGQWLLACVWPATTPRPVTLWQRHGSGWPGEIPADHDRH